MFLSNCFDQTQGGFLKWFLFALYRYSRIGGIRFDEHLIFSRIEIGALHHGGGLHAGALLVYEVGHLRQCDVDAAQGGIGIDHVAAVFIFIQLD